MIDSDEFRFFYMLYSMPFHTIKILEKLNIPQST